MKLVNLLLVGVLVGSSQAALAENPVTEMFDAVKDMMTSGGDVAKEGMEAGSDVVKEAADSAQEATKDIADAAKDAAESAQDVTKDAADVAKDTADSVQDVAKDSVDIAKDVAEEVADAAKDVGDTTKDAGESAVQSVADMAEEESDDFKWTNEVITAVENGDPKKGEVLAKEARCSKCHGDTGVSDEDDTPSIAGQITAYSYKQLHDYKVKLRDDRDMLKKVKKLSNQDMIDISAWYATQKPEVMAGDKNGNVPVLANKGDKKRFLIACDTCHDEEAMKRGFQTPIIEGQKPEHFIETMMAFKEGDRVNDHYKLMQSIASKLTEEEITELAAYYAAEPMKDE